MMVADKFHPTMTTRPLSVARLEQLLLDTNIVPIVDARPIAEKILEDSRLTATYDEPEIKLPQTLETPPPLKYALWFSKIIEDKVVTQTVHFDKIDALERHESNLLSTGWHVVRYVLEPRKYAEDSDRYVMIIGSYKNVDMHDNSEEKK